jgi:hypothetical protein
MNKKYLLNKYFKPLVVLQLLLLFNYNVSYGQQLTKNNKSCKNNWVIDLNIGFAEFFGDAANDNYFKKFNGQLSFTGGLTARKMIVPFFGIGGNFQYAGLYSKKLYNAMGQPVNFELIGNYNDFNIHGYIDFGSLFWGYNEKRWFTVYTTLGIGVAFWNSSLYDHVAGTVKNSGNIYNGIKYNKVSAVVPIGVGLNFKVAKNWALNLEGNLRTVLSDDVDVWDDGFPFDQPFLTTLGVSYYINYGFGKKKKNCGCKKKSYDHLDKIPIYDYRPVNQSLVKKPEPAKPKTVELDLLKIEDNKKSTKGIVYRVQILAKRTKLNNISLFKEKYNITDDIHENYQNGIYRYSIGYFRNYQDALNYSNIIKQKGIFDAFVVVYKDNVRIPLTPELKK